MTSLVFVLEGTAGKIIQNQILSVMKATQYVYCGSLENLTSDHVPRGVCGRNKTYELAGS
jgi:hypothetical protein